MSNLSDEELLAYNKQGLIPGPDESEVEFIRRAQYCVHLRQKLAESSEMPLSFEQLEFTLSKEVLDPVFSITKPLFDIAPEWMPIIFGNEQMPPWHGGCAWIFQLEDSTPTAAMLQLRKQFQYSERYLGIYNRTEIISHELAHVGRMLFQEPRFEEIIAYRTSKSTLRRWLGPIVESSNESLLFVLMLGLVIMADIALIATGQHVAYQWAMWLKVIPVSLIGYGLFRVGYKQHQFKQCLKNLEELYQNVEVAQAVIYRLTDDEIVLFSQSSLDEIKAYISDHQATSFRWRLITIAYRF